MSRSSDEQGPAEARRWAGEEAARDFAHGDHAAVAEVGRRVRLILSAGRFRFSPEERQDLEQEAMTQLWVRVRRPEFQIGPGFWGFVRQVTVARCIDRLRTARHELPPPEDLPAPGEGPLAAIAARQRLEIANAALAALDEPCRELIQLQVGEGLSYKQISVLLGRRETALRVQMHRCVGRARELVEAELTRRRARPGRVEGSR